MNGFIRKARVLGFFAIGALATSGCVETYNELVDPCWPQRWNCKARDEVHYHFDTQANNGLVLEQTVWNSHFREGTDELAPNGQALLDRLVRRRPEPVREIFVQTAHDLRYVADKPEAFGAGRADLNAKRVKAVQTYLGQVRPDVNFQITVHDPGRAGMSAGEAGRATTDHLGGASGTLAGGTSGAGGGGAVGSPAGSR